MSSRSKRMVELCTTAPAATNVNNLQDNLVYECELINNYLVPLSDISNKVFEPNLIDAIQKENDTAKTLTIIGESNDNIFLPPLEEPDYYSMPMGGIDLENTNIFEDTEKIVNAVQSISDPLSEKLVDENLIETIQHKQPSREDDVDDPEWLPPTETNEVDNEIDEVKNGTANEIG